MVLLQRLPDVHAVDLCGTGMHGLPTAVCPDTFGDNSVCLLSFPSNACMCFSPLATLLLQEARGGACRAYGLILEFFTLLERVGMTEHD
jgi:hypothetical protein